MLDISNFPWAECSIVDQRIMYQSDSLSLKRSKRDTGVLRYEFELVTVDMDLKVGRGVKAKLSRAVNDTLLFTHPRLSFSGGTVPESNIKVFSSLSAGVDEVILTSIEPWQLLAGDYIQFSNDTKVYEIGDDTDLQAGSQTVKLTNKLRNAITANSIVTANNVTWYLTSNGSIETSMTASGNQDIQLTLVAVEQL